MLGGQGPACEGGAAAGAGEGGRVAGGLFFRAGLGGPPSPGPLARTFGAAASRRIDRVFGSDSAMARALVMGDMTSIPPEVRDRYARSGLVHMLSVSGLHVAHIPLPLEPPPP